MNTVKVEKRNEQVKAKQLRRDGNVPCCVYGGSLSESLSIQLAKQAADLISRTMREGSKLKLELDGEQMTVQIKELKRCPLNSAVEHIQFQALKADQKVKSVTHIFLKNMELVPGVLEQLLFEVPFTALPKDMIDTVTVDLEGMQAGTILTVKDIPEFQSDNVELLIPDDSTVLRISDKKGAPAAAEESAAAE